MIASKTSFKEIYGCNNVCRIRIQGKKVRDFCNKHISMANIILKTVITVIKM